MASEGCEPRSQREHAPPELALALCNFQTALDWVLSGAAAPAPTLIQTEMVKQFVSRSGTSTFIETGTYEGETTAQIAATGVRVVTIELSPELHQEAVTKFADTPNVQCLHGDSGKLLPYVLSQLNEPAVFWLDGHYSAGKTALGDRITPLVEELYHILHHAINSHIVLIDNVRCLDGVTYPSVELVVELTRLYWPNSRVDVLHDILRIRPAAFPL